ncbi:YdcF family protein [Anaerohalosphaera lusitana]|uniref:YdcF family protein n=1 Tax=Anaerohalosphaera lusitana TaxID=1936003 RepID=UPI0014740925|nr:YdcF family protein [Anaerohalosphaera lusitana]
MWDRERFNNITEVVSRGAAGFLGIFTLLNVAAEYLIEGFDANRWWIDFRPMPNAVSVPVLAVFSVLLLAYAILPRMSGTRRRITVFLCFVMLLVVIANIWQFYYLVINKRIEAGCYIPFSSFVAIGMAVVLLGLHNKNADTQNAWCILGTVVTVLVCSALFTVGQMVCFGSTDYRRHADAAVVFGARAYADGSCSQALSDRVVTACKLYKANLCDVLIFSGGPGDGDVHETEAMKRLAVQLGVKEDHILLDRNGLNTRMTVANTVKMSQAYGYDEIMAVSHFYHLPRIKMSFQRAGFDVYTVPARHTHGLRDMPFYMAREMAAMLYYYIEPLGELVRGKEKGPADATTGPWVNETNGG